jgi:N-acetylglucosamine-6-sulfatase
VSACVDVGEAVGQVQRNLLRLTMRLLALLALCASAAAKAKAPPNIVWFLTDDQDQMLGASFPITSARGATPMPKTKAKMADMGATATNFFIHTPICCPSRSELVSGRYFHNIKTNEAPACMHVNENLVNNNTFAKYLAEAGYTVGMFGALSCDSNRRMYLQSAR